MKLPNPLIVVPAIAFPFIFLFLFLAIPAHAAECDNIGKQLRGGFEATQGHSGGMWGMMEQTEAYRNDSMIGMQIDSKLQLSIVIFETKCQNGEKPGKDLADKISAFIDWAREIKNTMPRGEPDKLIPELKALNTSIGKFIDDLS